MLSVVFRTYTKNIEMLKNIYTGAPSIHEDYRGLKTRYINAPSVHEDYRHLKTIHILVLRVYTKITEV